LIREVSQLLCNFASHFLHALHIIAHRVRNIHEIIEFGWVDSRLRNIKEQVYTVANSDDGVGVLGEDAVFLGVEIGISSVDFRFHCLIIFDGK
jgi:hypothetical protein